MSNITNQPLNIRLLGGLTAKAKAFAVSLMEGLEFRGDLTEEEVLVGNIISQEGDGLVVLVGWSHQDEDGVDIYEGVGWFKN